MFTFWKHFFDGHKEPFGFYNTDGDYEHLLKLKSKLKYW